MKFTSSKQVNLAERKKGRKEKGGERLETQNRRGEISGVRVRPASSRLTRVNARNRAITPKGPPWNSRLNLPCLLSIGFRPLMSHRLYLDWRGIDWNGRLDTHTRRGEGEEWPWNRTRAEPPIPYASRSSANAQPIPRNGRRGIGN